MSRQSGVIKDEPSNHLNCCRTASRCAP